MEVEALDKTLDEAMEVSGAVVVLRGRQLLLDGERLGQDV